jgi:hypothetical protein
MSANPQEIAFVHNYSKVLVQAWTDTNYRSLLESNPAAALSQYGLVTQPGATIKVVEEVGGSGNLQDQFKAWQTGQTSGSYTLYVPSKPQLGQGSDPGMATEDSYCCCCCPCCTCT